MTWDGVIIRRKSWGQAMRPIVFLLLLIIACALPPGSARAAFTLTAKGQSTVRQESESLQAALEISAGGSGGHILYDPDTRTVLAREGAVFDFNFTFSPLPAGWDPSSELQNLGLFATTAFTPIGGTQFSTGASGSYTHHGATARLAYGAVKYIQRNKSGAVWDIYNLVPQVNFAPIQCFVETRSEDGAVQNSLNAFNPAPLETLLPQGTAAADLAFDVQLYTTDQTHNGAYMALQKSVAPAAGVETRIVFTDGTVTNNVLNRFYETPWVRSGSDGKARITVGSGRETVQLVGLHRSPKLFVQVNLPGDSHWGQGYLPKLLVYDSMQSFKGTLKFKVTDPDGDPIKNSFIEIWGGPVPLGSGSWPYTANDAGEVSVVMPPGAGASPVREIKVTLNPRALLEGHLTQIIDDPPAIQGQSPLYLSPRISLHPDAATYQLLKPSGTVRMLLRILDEKDQVVNGGDLVLGTVKHQVNWKPGELIEGQDRRYIKIKPTEEAKVYRLRAVFRNAEPEAVEREQVAGECAIPVRLGREPGRARPIHFQFVAVSSQKPAVSAATSVLGSRLGSAQMAGFMKLVQQFMPAPVTFSTGPDQTASSWYSDSGRVKYYLKHLRNYRPKDVDLVIGVVASGDLETYMQSVADLFASGGSGQPAGVSDPAYPEVVLIDPRRITSVGALHEFMHTLGLSDNYGKTDANGNTIEAPAAADGYDDTTRKPVLSRIDWPAYPQRQAMMYDAANAPWLTAAEYGKLLNYATVPIDYEKPASAARQAPLAAAAPQKVMLISTRFRWSGKPFESAPVLAEREPVFTDWDTPDLPQPALIADYAAPGIRLATAGGAVVQGAWIAPPYALGVPRGVPFDPRDAGAWLFKVPAREDYQSVEYGSYDWRKNFTANQVVPATATAPQAAWSGPAAGTVLKETATISFSVSDPDSPELFAWVKVSCDDGQTWRPAAPPFRINPGLTRYPLDCRQFPSTAQCRFKVLVSDGVRSSILEPATRYTLQGYDPNPALALGMTAFTLGGNAPLNLVIPLVVRNTGRAPLAVTIDPATLPAWIVAADSRLEGTVQPQGEELFLLRGTLAAAGVYAATLRVKSNDPQTPAVNFPVRVTLDATLRPPQVLLVQSDPPAPDETPIRPRGTMRFTAWEKAGRTGLRARITIEQTRPQPAFLLREGVMTPGAVPGQYVYDWTVPAGAAGCACGVNVTMTDPAGGLADVNGSTGDGWDLAFTLAGAGNRPPAFTAPAAEASTLEVQAGREVLLTYAVGDPDGDPLSLNLNYGSAFAASNNMQARWDAAARQIRFTPNFGGAYTLMLSAMDPAGAIACRQWTVNAASDTAAGHASVSNADYTLLAAPTQPLSASTRGGGGDKGCRFDWRLQGTAAWNKSALVAWRAYAGDPGYLYANLAWNVSALAAGATYEVRYVNVNAQGQDEPNPVILHFVKPASGGRVTRIEAPAAVWAGRPFSFRVYVLNTSTFTWTRAGGYQLSSGAAPDPFTRTTSLELGDVDMVPPGATAVYQAWATAPAAPGSLVTRWQPFTAALKSYGTAGSAAIRVLAVPAVETDALRGYLLGLWTPGANWLAQADLNGDKQVNIADLIHLKQLLSQVQ